MRFFTRFPASRPSFTPPAHSPPKLRRTPYLLAGLGLVVAAISGCEPTEEIGDPPCAEIAEAPLRNPQTGVCESRGSFDCSYGDVAPMLEPLPPWAACYTACDGLDEVACAAHPTCQAAYLDEAFWGCWEVNIALDGDGLCGDFDAYGCSASSSCSPHYYSLYVHPDADGEGGGTSTGFDYCADDIDNPDPGLTCANVLCNVGTHCEELPGGPTCVPNTPGPGTCYGDVTCNALLPDCPQGTLPGIDAGCYTGYCIPLAACEPAPTCEALNEDACIDRQDCAPLYVACEPTEDCMFKFWGCTQD